jgi:4-amino-4-deoxy-L-arabinose transferase-like glycosyltransferase
MTRTTVVRPADPTLRSALWLAFAFAAAKLLLHIATTLWVRHIGYGYFRDEFYYIMCGRHLAWGYVDHGPMVALQARVSETLFGDSLLGIRMLSAVGGAIRVFLTGMLCWSLGGRRAGQALAMLMMLCAPLYLGIDSYLSMNSWESAFWMTALLALIMILRKAGTLETAGAPYSGQRCVGSEAPNNPVFWWTILGIAAGLGLLNKPSEVFFLIAILIALLISPQRRVLFTKRAAWGIALLILIATPNLIWQIHNHWPTLEFLHNGRAQGKNLRLNPLAFMLNQVLVIGPIGAFVWIAGLVHLLRNADRRWIGLTYLILLAIMIALGAKDYYFAPIYPVMFAAGGIAWQRRYATRPRLQQDRAIGWPLLTGITVALSLLFLPASIPVLKPAAYLHYAKTMHLPKTDSESGPQSVLPQFYADRFGWQEQVDTITRIVNQLPPEDRTKVGIFNGNYGEAGALEFLGHNLPPVISEHNNYWIWGTRGIDGEVMIINRRTTPEALSEFYDQVQIVGHVSHPLGMPYENHDIFLVRHRKMPLGPDWAESKFYY